MLDGVSLDHLRTFIAAVDEGSFSAVARKLRRAKSVVSGLEAQMGVRPLGALCFGKGDRRSADKIYGQEELGRAGLPYDIGPMIASLLSEDNRWVNAQRIEVSGGMSSSRKGVSR